MDLISLLSTVLLVTTIGTLVVAIAAHLAFRLRDKRRPDRTALPRQDGGSLEPIFLERYSPAVAAVATAPAGP